MDIKERMKSNKLYYCIDEKLMKEQLECLDLLYDFNMTRPSEQIRRREILKELLADIGKNCYIEPPLHANWGRNTHLGNNVNAKYKLTLVDDTDIDIEGNIMIGPNVIIDTGTHPINPDLRKKQAQYNVAVVIEENVWIGGGSIILPGVRIGKNSVIGAGSVVTKDIPENVVAVGNPCRVMREIGERDEKYYYKNLEIDIE